MISFSVSILFIISAFLTSALAAVTGMAGGVLLFSVLSFFLPLSILVPVHGMVQLGSNASRLGFLWEHIRWRFALRFFIGAILGAVAATSVQDIYHFPATIPLVAVSLLIFYVLFRPKKLPKIEVKPNTFLFIGFLAGIMGIFIGTVGPFLAAFFIRDDFTKEEIIGTKAVMQAFIHLTKVPAFLYLGFAFQDYTLIIVLMIMAAILGTKVGVLFLKRMSAELFMVCFKVLLFIGAVRLLFKGIE